MISEKRIEPCVKILAKKAKQEPDFEKRLNESVRRMFEYKIKQKYLEVFFFLKGLYEVKIIYPEPDTRLRNDNFNVAKQMNIKLYTENFK